MRNQIPVFLMLVFLCWIIAACSKTEPLPDNRQTADNKPPAPESSKPPDPITATNNSQTPASVSTNDIPKKVTFKLLHRQNAAAPPKPVENAEIAIFPIDNDEILVSDDNRRGLGKTDSQGQATIEFRGSKNHSRYAVTEYVNGVYMVLRRQGILLTFECGSSPPVCNVGNLMFETFEFRKGN